jgi:hypothetical protein
VAQSFLEGGDHAEPRHLAGFMSARGVEVLCAATAGGLVVLRVWCVDGEIPIRARGAERPAWVQPALAAFRAGRVLFAGLTRAGG